MIKKMEGNNQKKKALTLEDLSAQMASGFRKIDQRFEQVDTRFDQVDKRFEKVDTRFEQVDKKFGQINQKLEKIDKSIDIKIEELARYTQKEFLALNSRIENIEIDIREIKNDTIEIKANLNKKVDKIAHNELVYRVERLEKNFA